MDPTGPNYITAADLTMAFTQRTFKNSITYKFLKLLDHLDKSFDILKRLDNSKSAADAPLTCLHVLEPTEGHNSMRLDAALDSIDKAISHGRRYVARGHNLLDVLGQLFISSARPDELLNAKTHDKGVSTYPPDHAFISIYQIRLDERTSQPVILTFYDENSAHFDTSPISKITYDKGRKSALLRYAIPEHLAEMLFRIITDYSRLEKFAGAPVNAQEKEKEELKEKASTSVAIVTSSNPVSAQYLSGAKSDLYVMLEQAFQALRQTPEGKITPTQVSKSRFLVYSSKAWKAAIGDTQIPISQISSVNTGTFKGRRILLNLNDSKSRSALRDAVKKNYGFEVTVGDTIYIFKINGEVHDGDYFAIPEDPDRDENFDYDENELSSGCLFFRIEGGVLEPKLYSIDRVPKGMAHMTTETRSGSDEGDMPEEKEEDEEVVEEEEEEEEPKNDLEFDEEKFVHIKTDMKESQSHYRLALKFEICVFRQFAKLAKKEFSSGVSLMHIASNDVKELTRIHKQASMDDHSKLNLTILYLSMARAFSDKIGLSFSETVNTIASAVGKVDLTRLFSDNVNPKAKECLAHLIRKANSIMGYDPKRFSTQKQAAIQAYKSIVNASNTATSAFLHSHPLIARLLVAHLITSAYSIFLSSDKHKNISVFTKSIALAF